MRMYSFIEAKINSPLKIHVSKQKSKGVDKIWCTSNIPSSSEVCGRKGTTKLRNGLFVCLFVCLYVIYISECLELPAKLVINIRNCSNLMGIIIIMKLKANSNSFLEGIYMTS
jgi:hypothetical protein